MPLSSLRRHRDELRQSLIRSRLRPAQTMNRGIVFAPYCDWCDEPIPPGGVLDLHEWLIKRSDVQSWPSERQIQIYTEINCAILHRRCHTRFGQTKAMTRKLCERAIRVYGTGPVVEFINSLGLRQHVDPTAREVLADMHIEIGAK